MKIKDLVKDGTYNVFDYKSFSGFSFWSVDDNCFVPAVYLGRLDGYHWFEELDSFHIYRYSAEDIHFGYVKEVEDNECV